MKGQECPPSAGAAFSTSLHRLVDAAIAADDALREEGFGERLDKAFAHLDANASRVLGLYRQAKAAHQGETR